MTNHPNRSRTYWRDNQRGFANEYTIGVATTRDAAKSYEAQGWERITRDVALRGLAYRGDAATQACVGHEIDGEDDGQETRFELAARIRAGR